MSNGLGAVNREKNTMSATELGMRIWKKAYHKLRDNNKKH